MKKRFSIRAVIFACIAGIIISTAGAGIYFLITFGGAAGFSAATKFASIYNILDSLYIGEADMNEVSIEAYRAMVDAIDDRWSYYMTAEEYENYKEYQNNSYIGIGVTIGQLDGDTFLTVKSVAENSPAQRAGISYGDKLIAFDGQSLENKSTNELKELMSSKNGEEFELTVRTDDNMEKTVTISVERVFSNPVEYYMLPDSIGYIKIKNFEGESADRSISAVNDLIEQGAKGIVFDMRNNPGGLLSELTKLLDHLLPEGDIFVSVNESGNETVTRSDAKCVDIPMTVLVNKNTYSAAEFFAAALSEYNMAEIVGEPTTGKSRSQINLKLSDGSAVHLSTNGYLTPNRVDLAEQGGLIPDHKIILSEEDDAKLVAGELPFEDDAQLQEAFEVLLG